MHWKFRKIFFNKWTKVLWFTISIKRSITLNKTEMNIPEYTEEGNIRIKNFFAGKKLNWKVSQINV